MEQLLDQLLLHLRGVWLRRFWGLGVAWVIAAVGLPIALLTPSQYEATARVFVNTESILKPLMQGLAVQPNTEQQIQILTDTLMSRPNVEKLILLADLDHTVQTEKQRNKLVEAITRGVQLKPTKDNLFSLSYRDTEPTRANRIVNALLSMFVEGGLSTKRLDTDKALAFLDAQIKEYEGVLAQAEERLKKFKLDNLDKMLAQDQVGSMLALDSEVQKTRTDFRTAEEKRVTLRRQLAAEEQAAADPILGGPGGPGGGLAELDSRADALRRNLDELLRKYTEQHPDVIGTRRILADLDKQRQALLEASTSAAASPVVPNGNTRRAPNLVVQQLKLTLADAEANAAALKVRLSELESRYDRIRAAAKLKPEFEEEFAKLNRDYQIQKSKFEQLVQRREAAKLTGELNESGSVDFKVIDPPRVKPEPVAPDRLLLIGAVLMLSLGAGVATSFVASQAFPTVSTVKELRTVAQTSVLGSVSYRLTPVMVRRQKRQNYVFAGGVTGFCALFGVALALLLVAAGPH